MSDYPKLNLEGFKKETKKFFDRVADSSITEERLALAKKGYVLQYLNLALTGNDAYQAQIAFQLALKEYVKRSEATLDISTTVADCHY